MTLLMGILSFIYENRIMKIFFQENQLGGICLNISLNIFQWLHTIVLQLKFGLVLAMLDTS